MRTGDDYTLVGTKVNGVVVVEFSGTFESETVIWQAEIRCLYQQPSLSRSYIDIKPPLDGKRPVTVGLPLRQIDRAAIIKTITMIRGYKRLMHGRHEFGDQIKTK